jgi:hypothetical protein
LTSNSPLTLDSLSSSQRSVDCTRRFSQNSVSTAIATASKSAYSTELSGLALALAAVLALTALHITRLIDFAAYTTTIDVNGPFRILSFPEGHLPWRRPCRPAVFGHLPTVLPKRFRIFVPEQHGCPARSWFSSLYGRHMVEPVRLVRCKVLEPQLLEKKHAMQ